MSNKKLDDIEKAALNRQHHESLVWMVIQCTKSIVSVGAGNEIDRDIDGNFKYCPDETGWETLREEDVPEWVKQPNPISEMKDGGRVCCQPTEGGRWYRGAIMETPEELKQVH